MTELDTFQAVIVSRADETEMIASIVLRAADGRRLPAWSAGDHIDIETGAGMRQYSLCGPLDAESWTVAVLREEGGRGGSAWLHSRAQPGEIVTIGAPRSTFHQKSGASRLFIAGGVGITPIMSMIEQAERAGEPWTLFYTARAEAGHAFTERLASDPRVTLWTSSLDGRADIRSVIEAAPGNAAISCCGSGSLIDAVLEAAEAIGRKGDVAVERFQAVEVAHGADRPFSLELARRGITLEVAADAAALDVLGEAGIFIASSCREGICGSCETVVLEGEVDHRDSLLDDDERAENSCFFPCVSRASGDKLVLDL